MSRMRSLDKIRWELDWHREGMERWKRVLPDFLCVSISCSSSSSSSSSSSESISSTHWLMAAKLPWRSNPRDRPACGRSQSQRETETRRERGLTTLAKVLVLLLRSGDAEEARSVAEDSSCFSFSEKGGDREVKTFIVLEEAAVL
jgi:hypothetical protein